MTDEERQRFIEGLQYRKAMFDLIFKELLFLRPVIQHSKASGQTATVTMTVTISATACYTSDVEYYRNSALENFLLHTRAFLESICPLTKKNENYVGKFLPDWSPPETVAGQKPGRLYGEISQHLAHIPLEPPEKHGWDWKTIYREISLLVNRILSQISQGNQPQVGDKM